MLTAITLLQGFGWAIAKALAEAGAEISLGVWVSVPHISPLRKFVDPNALQLASISSLSGACTQHLREQPEAWQVRRVEEALERLTARIQAHPANGRRLRLPRRCP